MGSLARIRPRGVNSSLASKASSSVERYLFVSDNANKRTYISLYVHAKVKNIKVYKVQSQSK